MAKHLLQGTNENVIYFWDVATGELKKTIQTEWGSESLVYSPDGTTLASCGGKVYLWDASTGELLKTVHRTY